MRVPGHPQALLEPCQIAVHDRLQVRVEHSRREPLELAIFGDHVRRAGHGEPWIPALRGVGDRSLVRRVQIRVQQAHRDRLGAGGHRGVERALDARRVERGQDRAVGRQALEDLEAMLALDDRLGAHERRHEERRNIALGAPDLDQVTETGGRQDRHARTAPLEHGIGADGRTVDEPPHVAARDTQRLEP